MPDLRYQAVQDEEALLEGGDSIALHSAIDEGSDEDDELYQDSLSDHKSARQRPAPENGDDRPIRSRRPWQRCCSCRSPSRTCVIITFLLLAALVTLLGGGGLWVYKNAPVDGQSPPWYPSPR